MAKTRPKSVTAKLRLKERQDGDVQIEILTSRPLESFHHRTWIGWDPKRQEHIWEDHGVLTPGDYLRNPSTFGLMFHGGEPDKWRYIRISASAPIEGVMHSLGERQLDLSERSEERRLLAVLGRQDEIPLVWVNEGVEVTYPAPESTRANILVALETTRGTSSRAWKEELAELAWRESASWRPGPRPRVYKPRSVAPPTAPVPYFAPRSGRIPGARGAELAGAQLPLGRRYPRGLPAAYWGSVDPVPNAPLIAAELVSVFSETGIWPLLWRFDDYPDAYMGGHGDLDAIDAIDVEGVLRELWSRHPWPPGSTEPFTEFPGLAPAASDRARGVNPFAAPVGEPAGTAAWLLLVPCNRPADAITTLGGVGGVIDPPMISAVLRSWEERFSATAYELAPDLVILSIAAPPTNREDALLVAAEHMAFCPPDDGGAPGALRRVANDLVTAAGPSSESYRSSRERWYAGWFD